VAKGKTVVKVPWSRIIKLRSCTLIEELSPAPQEIKVGQVWEDKCDGERGKVSRIYDGCIEIMWGENFDRPGNCTQKYLLEHATLADESAKDDPIEVAPGFYVGDRVHWDSVDGPVHEIVVSWETWCEDKGRSIGDIPGMARNQVGVAVKSTRHGTIGWMQASLLTNLTRPAGGEEKPEQEEKKDIGEAKKIKKREPEDDPLRDPERDRDLSRFHPKNVKRNCCAMCLTSYHPLDGHTLADCRAAAARLHGKGKIKKDDRYDGDESRHGGDGPVVEEPIDVKAIAKSLFPFAKEKM